MRQLATMTRQEMIRRLVEFSVNAALGDSRRYWLSDLFERGFVGYRKFSDRRLWRELQLRGLVQPEDTFVDGDAEDFAPDDASVIRDLPIEAGTKEID
jgi:hypothetical protein